MILVLKLRIISINLYLNLNLNLVVLYIIVYTFYEESLLLTSVYKNIYIMGKVLKAYKNHPDKNRERKKTRKNLNE